MSSIDSVVTVVGLGYIGLPTAAVLAATGLTVQGYDINPKAVEVINQGQAHIVEKNLDELIAQVVAKGKLTAYLEPKPADVFVIAVPTPFKDQHTPDLKHVKSAIDAIAPLLKAGNLVIIESTSPVGTLKQVGQWLKTKRPEYCFQTDDPDFDATKQVFMAYCPERVLPGKIIEELKQNNRVVGADDLLSQQHAQQFYQHFVSSEIFITDSRTAELCKLVENAYRDVNIAFANELANICDTLDMNVWELVKLANKHPRVNILQPGPGVGGHCIAVDPWFIVDSVPEEAQLIHTARKINDERPQRVLKKILAASQAFDNPTIACFGLAYKKDIDDLRESPALTIVKQLSEKTTGEIIVHEPHIDELPAALKDVVNLNNEKDEVLARSDIVVLLVDHQEYLCFDSHHIGDKVIIDTRGLWSNETT